MNQELTLQNFLVKSGVIFDVRTPAEYSQGKIPESINLPLFTNEERVLIGTAYKKQGKNIAIELGLEIIGPKMAILVKNAKDLIDSGAARVHCWRGGLRSHSVSWLLNLFGIHTFTLKGGYKSFRRWVLNEFQALKAYKFIVVGGMTGSGKTEILKLLKQRGEQVIDLEALALHRGSSFGMIDMPSQTSNEQFENDLAYQLHKFDCAKTIWIEDESRMLGNCQIPNSLIESMRTAPLVLIQPSLEERIDRLCTDYSHVDPHLLIAATSRISKKLGGLRTQLIIKLIESQNLPEAVRQLLSYYDSTYQHSLNKHRGTFYSIKETKISVETWAELLLGKKNKISYKEIE